MNKKSTTIIIIILGIVIFVLPIIPITYQILYKEEVPILKLTSHTNVVLNSTTLTLEGGTYQFWQKEIEDYKTARFSLRTNETINAAIMSLEEFETFQKTMLMNQTMQSMQDTTSINIEYQIPITETYFFVIHNAHDGLKGAEKKEATINLDGMVGVLLSSKTNKP